MRAPEFLTVAEARDCASQPALDALKIVSLKVLPLYAAAAAVSKLAVIAVLVTEFILWLVDKLVRSWLVDRCLLTAASRHVWVDKRVTVASAKESPTGKRVRKRVHADRRIFTPGGGEFGGAGAGANWSATEPITGIEITAALLNDWMLDPEWRSDDLQTDQGELGTQLVYFGSESRPIRSEGSIERIWAGDDRIIAPLDRTAFEQKQTVLAGSFSCVDQQLYLNVGGLTHRLT